MSTAVIIVIVVVVVILLIAMLVALPRMRQRTQLKQRERRLDERRPNIAADDVRRCTDRRTEPGNDVI